MNNTSHRHRVLLATVALAAALGLAACGGTSSNTKDTTNTTNAASSADPAVLPVTSNPITNTATARALTVDSVLVENNVDPATGSAADDHLEIALTNTGAATLDGFEIYYTFTDPTTNTSESYYLALPATFTIAPGTSRIAHFDNTGAPDHFPVNEFSLYKTSTNAMDVTVMVSASGAAPETVTVQKDAGGPEEAD